VTVTSPNAPARLRTTWRYGLRVRDHKAATLGLLIIVTFGLLAVLASAMAPYPVHKQVGPVFGPPSPSHPLGLDDTGADVLSLVIMGTRVSMLVGVVSTVVAVSLGGLIGILAGYFGGRTDAVLMRLTDVFLVVPVLPLMIVVAALWGPSISHAILIIGLLSWTPTARVLRAQVLVTRERLFVRRAKALGAGHLRIIWHHVLPRVQGLLVANSVIVLASAIFFEAALAFLGLQHVTTISWGTLIANAFNRAASSAGAWWAFIPPGVCIALIVFACSLVAMALEDAGNGRALESHIFARRLKVVSPDER
jgi:peptide/nickel transport system permease protein